MSFAGHVFDMIKRDRQNREMLKYRRKKIKDSKLKAQFKKTHIQDTNISFEALERVIKNKRERELGEERRYLFAQLKFLSVILIALLIILVIRCIIIKH